MARSYGPVATDRNRDQPHVKRMMPVPFLLQARHVTCILRLLPETVDASCWHALPFQSWYSCSSETRVTTTSSAANVLRSR